MKEEEKNLQLQIRCLVSTVRDLQKVRISIGNRIVQSFYIQMGINPGEKKDTADKDSMAMIAKLQKEYKRVSDLMSENNYSIKKQLKNMPSNDSLKYIKSELDYKLIKQYVDILQTEEDTQKIVAKYVHEHPMWDRFFKDVYGCGEWLAGVCIAYLDIDVARHVSSFWKYCGIDTVLEKDNDGNVIYFPVGKPDIKLVAKKVFVDKFGEVCNVKAKFTGKFNLAGEAVFIDNNGNEYTEQMVTRKVGDEVVQVYKNIETDEDFVGEVRELRHGRRMGDTEMREYVDRDGKTQTKRSITYNPEIKTMLLGVLASNILKTGQRFGENKYEKMYRDSRMRLDSMPEHADKRDGQKHKMSIRFMIKNFLKDLWVEWRSYAGYELSKPYEEEYLGRKPHGYNEAFDE